MMWRVRAGLWRKKWIRERAAVMVMRRWVGEVLADGEGSLGERMVEIGDRETGEMVRELVVEMEREGEQEDGRYRLVGHAMGVGENGNEAYA